MNITSVALTTVDNPYDPFKEFDAWYAFDLNRELTHRDESYVNCCSILDRFAHTSDALSESENIEEIDRAINRIIAIDPMNVYKKVKAVVSDGNEIKNGKPEPVLGDGPISSRLKTK